MNARPAVEVPHEIPSLVDQEEGQGPVSLIRETPIKPLLRGVSHQIAFFVAIFATAFLFARAPSGTPSIVALVFGASMVFLFGVSSLYHRIDWSAVGRQRMRRLDHAAIFVLIAGGYTPLFALVAKPSTGSHDALYWIWGGASIGIVKSLLWPNAPKWLTALLCVGLGWMVILEVAARDAVVGPLATWALVASGFTYSVGALVYALKRPNPFPRTFGYHEIFHAIVICASVFLFTHVSLVVLR